MATGTTIMAKTTTTKSSKEEEEETITTTNITTHKNDNDSSSIVTSNKKGEKGEQQPSSFLRVVSLILKHYTQFIGTNTTNQDKGLKFLQRTFWLLSFLYSTSKKNANAWKKVSSNISFARYLLRFYSFPSAILDTIIQSNNNKSLLNGKLIMSWSMVLYHPLEHLAYIRWTSPDLYPPSSGASTTIKNANRLSALSCRFWFAYIIIDIVQAIYRIEQIKRQKKKELVLCGDEESDDLVQLDRSMVDERLRGLRSLLFTFPCYSWSLSDWDTNPWLSETYENSILWIESALSMYQAIRTYYIKNK